MSPRRAAINPECLVAVADHFAIPMADVLGMPIRYFQRLHSAICDRCCGEAAA